MKWLIIAGCSQLNTEEFGGISGNKYAKGWAGTVLGNDDSTHGVLGYWMGALNSFLQV